MAVAWIVECTKRALTLVRGRKGLVQRERVDGYLKLVFGSICCCGAIAAVAFIIIDRAHKSLFVQRCIVRAVLWRI